MNFKQLKMLLVLPLRNNFHWVMMLKKIDNSHQIKGGNYGIFIQRGS
jgi:hypothetical protein